MLAADGSADNIETYSVITGRILLRTSFIATKGVADRHSCRESIFKTNKLSYTLCDIAYKCINLYNSSLKG